MMELVDACKAMVERDPDFLYDCTTDENGKVENIAWTFGDSVHAYTVFGDVVTFDTTYRSITYGLLLGVWFGIDSHGKAIFFGSVLLQEENSHSFAWALQLLYRSDLNLHYTASLCKNITATRHHYAGTSQLHDTTILAGNLILNITDIDSKLKDAIARELPDTKHVIFISHILSKLSSWFSLPFGSQYADFKADFDMLCYLESVEDFEHQWNLLVARFGLVPDKHIALLFSYRASWPLSYIRSYFLAHMLTAEFSQSLDSILEKNLKCTYVFASILFEQVGFAANLQNRPRVEMQSMHIKTCMPIEEHARSILTPYAFNVLQHEIVLSMEYATTEMANGSYLVRHYKKMDGEYLVIWIPDGEQIHCSWHSLQVLVVKNYFELPEKYCLHLWRLESSLVPTDDQHAQSSSDECTQAFHSLAAGGLREKWDFSLLQCSRFLYLHAREVSAAPEAKFVSMASPTQTKSNRGVEKHADINWDELGFDLVPADYMYVTKCGKEENFTNEVGNIIPYANIAISPFAGILNYGQGLLESLKAYRRDDGRVLLFRPEQNAQRMQIGAERLCMPSPSIEHFVEAVKQTVLANKHWVPPPGKGSLYVRPLLIGSGPVLSLVTAPEISFLIHACPVGNYHKGPLNLLVEDKTHRATPGGTGDIKTITNYSPVYKAIAQAKARGFSDVLFLDAVTKKYIEEVSSCNIFIVKGNVISTPAICGTILPGITRKSIIEIALGFGYQVEERVIPLEDLFDVDEVFCTGTAVVVSPVASITYGDKRVEYKTGAETVSKKLYDMLTGIQTGRIEDKMGWTVEID